MKNIKRKISLGLSFIAIGAFIACNGNENKKSNGNSSDEHFNSVDDYEEVYIPNAHIGGATDITDSYFALKDALAGDNEEGAKESASILIQALSYVNTGDQDGGYVNEELVGLLEDLEGLARQITSSDIKGQREAFANMTEIMVDVYRITGIDRVIYVQYCPMYDNNKGGYWLSGEPNIYNPLFGSEMLECGIIEAELNSNLQDEAPVS